MFIYESHLGGIYYRDEALDLNELHCEQCGDYDNFLGEANTLEEATKLLEPITSKRYTNYEGCYLCDAEGHTSECDEFCDGTFDSWGYDEEYIIEYLEGMKQWMQKNL